VEWPEKQVCDVDAAGGGDAAEAGALGEAFDFTAVHCAPKMRGKGKDAKGQLCWGPRFEPAIPWVRPGFEPAVFGQRNLRGEGGGRAGRGGWDRWNARGSEGQEIGQAGRKAMRRTGLRRTPGAQAPLPVRRRSAR
jgi:hypothetical protein